MNEYFQIVESNQIIESYQTIESYQIVKLYQIKGPYQILLILESYSLMSHLCSTQILQFAF